jgi:hypothetical protein
MIVTPSERLPLVTLRNVDAMSHPSRGAIHTTLHSRARQLRFHVLHLYLETYAEPELAGQSLAMTSRDSAPYFDLTQGSRLPNKTAKTTRFMYGVMHICVSCNRDE